MPHLGPPRHGLGPAPLTDHTPIRWAGYAGQTPGLSPGRCMAANPPFCCRRFRAGGCGLAKTSAGKARHSPVSAGLTNAVDDAGFLSVAIQVHAIQLRDLVVLNAALALGSDDLEPMTGQLPGAGRLGAILERLIGLFQSARGFVVATRAAISSLSSSISSDSGRSPLSRHLANASHAAIRASRSAISSSALIFTTLMPWSGW